MLFEQEKIYIHQELRPHQATTLQTILDSPSRYIVAEMPTGAGKSFFPAQLAAWYKKVLALVKTKSLQDQYHRPPYQAEIVKGKNNYRCKLGMMPDASLCQITRKERAKNGCLDGCPYYQACSAFLTSQLGCLNYLKYLLECRGNGLATQYKPQYLFLDEAHQLSDLVIDYSGFSQSFTPFLLSFVQPIVISPHLPRELAIDKAVDWLSLLYQGLMAKEPAKPDKHSSTDQTRYYKQWDNLCRKVGTTIDLVESGKEYWYAESTKERGFRLKPLTARFHFSNLFQAPKVVLMSATIGNAKPFMAELGIYEDFQDIVVPDIWPPESRPIHDLQAPSYRNKMTEAERQEHARLIAKVLDNCPSGWNGLIHAQGSAMPGTKMIHDLANRLKKLTRRPIWLPSSDQGTEEALASWLQFEQRNRGAVAITHQFYEGVDLPNLNINITARIPYPDFGDPYEKERFDFDPKAAQVRVANIFRQQQGRDRRGYAEHYGPQAEKYNAVVDGKWTRLKWALSSGFVESIR